MMFQSSRRAYDGVAQAGGSESGMTPRIEGMRPAADYGLGVPSTGDHGVSAEVTARAGCTRNRGAGACCKLLPRGVN